MFFNHHVITDLNSLRPFSIANYLASFWYTQITFRFCGNFSDRGRSVVRVFEG